MVTIDQAIRGFSKFADREVIPHLPTGKGIAAGIGLALLLDGNRDAILALRDHPIFKMLNVMDTEGQVDIDRLYNAARPRFENKLPISIPFIGDLKFDQSDVDKLYRYIQEA